MKKTLLTLLLLCTTISTTFAQEEGKRQEVGINFSSLNSFGLTYRTGTATNLWRFNILTLNATKTNTSGDSSETDQTSIGGSISVGKEFRKTITKNLELRYGADLAFNYNHYSQESENSTDVSETNRNTYSPSVAGVIGVNYVFNSNLALGVELLPRFTYTTGTSVSTLNSVETETKISSYTFGLTNNFARLSLVYRF